MDKANDDQQESFLYNRKEQIIQRRVYR